MAKLVKLTYTVREVGVSRHNGGPINSPPETPQYDTAVMYEDIQGAPELLPHYAERDDNLSDSCTSVGLFLRAGFPKPGGQPTTHLIKLQNKFIQSEFALSVYKCTGRTFLPSKVIVKTSHSNSRK